MYFPAPPRPARPAATGGRRPRHGAVLKLAELATWPVPAVTIVTETPRYGTATAWGRLHQRLETRRPSKSLTLRKAEAVLKAAEQGSPRMRAYIVVSLLTGARTEEMRALHWYDIDLVGQPDADPPVPPHLVLVRSLRAGGDTKTCKSRADVYLHLPGHRDPDGKPMGARNVQRDFRKVMDAAGLVGRDWTPRELRQSFVSLLSDERVPLEVISRLFGHRSTTVTETVYRKQLRPVIEGGVDATDRIFPPSANSGP